MMPRASALQQAAAATYTKSSPRGVLSSECILRTPIRQMTDSWPDPTALPLDPSQRVHRSLQCLLVTRILLALVVISLVLFLFRWSGAVRRDTVPTPQGQQVPDEWKVVVPEYAGG